MQSHDEVLATAFDHQAPLFERAPVQTDRAALRRLVRRAAFAPEARVLDAGCGPGLVAEALLEAGRSVFGVDLSSAMVARAEARCGRFGTRFAVIQASLFDSALDMYTNSFNGAISRYVVHHVEDPRAFLARQVELLRPGGVLVACDHVTDPDAALAAWHNEIELLRDRSHTRSLTPGALVDLFATVGVDNIRLVEDIYMLDFDEWFDRGHSTVEKAALRRKLLSGPRPRGFAAYEEPGGGVRIEGRRVIVRGVKPGA